MNAAECWACVAGMHDECFRPEATVAGLLRCCCYRKETIPEAAPVGRPVAVPGEVTDVLSTGRKRAAMLYPVYDGMVCEWAYLKYAGGGVEPIIGCAGNLLYNERGKYARHHGPDKNTLENGPLNVHRICETCHNRWHTLNDPYYGERPEGGQPFLPTEFEWMKHDAVTRASAAEIAENEAMWSGQRTVSAGAEE